MKKLMFAAGLVLAIGGSAYASDSNGIYARIKEVVINKEAKTIKIVGTFALAKMNAEGMTDSQQEYHPPKTGYLYYTVAPGKEAESLAQWDDLAGEVGKNTCVTFGSRRDNTPGTAHLGKVHKLKKPLGTATAYPVRGTVSHAPADHPYCKFN